MPKVNEVKSKVAAEVDTKKETKVAETKMPEKAAEPKASVVKAEETGAAAKATEQKAPAKKAEPKTPAKKTTAKKAAEKKTTATKKTTTTKKAEESVCIQYAGNEIEVTDIVEKAKAAYGNAKAIKDIRVYVKPEEGMAYYVVNGYEEGKVAL